MSESTKRKHVHNEILSANFELPKENQTIVRVVENKGSQLYEIVTPSGEKYLASMPRKFRNKVYVFKGNCVLVEPIAEGKKVKAEIVQIMNEASIKFYKQNNIWPAAFEDSSRDRENKTDVETKDRRRKEKNSDSESGDDDLFVNTNYKRYADLYITDDSSDSDDEEE